MGLQRKNNTELQKSFFSFQFDALLLTDFSQNNEIVEIVFHSKVWWESRKENEASQKKLILTKKITFKKILKIFERKNQKLRNVWLKYFDVELPKQLDEMQKKIAFCLRTENLQLHVETVKNKIGTEIMNQLMVI